MWPWGHAALAYLCYVAVLRYRKRRDPATAAEPGEVGALAVVFGSQIADLIDKPLTWTLAILEYGRSFGHSLLVIVPILALLWWWLGDDHPEAVGALAVGWLSHPFGDAIGVVIDWTPEALVYFVWPLLPTPDPGIEQSFLAHLLALEADPVFAVELLLVAAAFVVWRRDGYPGLATIRARVTGHSLAGESR